MEKLLVFESNFPASLLWTIVAQSLKGNRTHHPIPLSDVLWCVAHAVKNHHLQWSKLRWLVVLRHWIQKVEEASSGCNQWRNVNVNGLTKLSSLVNEKPLLEIVISLEETTIYSQYLPMRIGIAPGVTTTILEDIRRIYFISCQHFHPEFWSDTHNITHFNHHIMIFIGWNISYGQSLNLDF